MKRWLIALGVLGALAAGPAAARVDVGISIGIPGVILGGPAYYPPPVVYHPPPVYVAPPRVVVSPPAAVYYQGSHRPYYSNKWHRPPGHWKHHKGGHRHYHHHRRGRD